MPRYKSELTIDQASKLKTAVSDHPPRSNSVDVGVSIKLLLQDLLGNAGHSALARLSVVQRFVAIIPAHLLHDNYLTTALFYLRLAQTAVANKVPPSSNISAQLIHANGLFQEMLELAMLDFFNVLADFVLQHFVYRKRLKEAACARYRAHIEANNLKKATQELAEEIWSPTHAEHDTAPLRSAKNWVKGKVASAIAGALIDRGYAKVQRGVHVALNFEIEETWSNYSDYLKDPEKFKDKHEFEELTKAYLHVIAAGIHLWPNAAEINSR